MPRKPDFDPEDVRQVMSAVPRPSSAQAAQILARRVGKPCSAGYIRGVLARHPEWELDEPAPPGDIPALDYECDRALGPIERPHKATNAWVQLTTYERHRAGLLGDTQATRSAEAYVTKRLRLGLVVDYHQSSGFIDRIALPWEEGCYLKQPRPDYAQLELETALADEPPGERREAWIAWREFDRIAEGGSLTRRNA